MSQTIGITIDSQKLSVPLPSLLALLSGSNQIFTPASPLPAEIGAELQGGIYVGPMAEKGRLIHLIAAKDTLPVSEWEAAAKAAEDYEGEGFSDWYLPSKAEMIVALAHAQDTFKESWHWTSTPYGSLYAWAVDFENGYVATLAPRHRVPSSSRPQIIHLALYPFLPLAGVSLAIHTLSGLSAVL